ncbi:site-specific integrase [Bradyrhizobium sp. BRP56]|uniref:tyrosine-type recombinase/integrase n=1 Tax=Bradyrhizobium sp. BRP56 TaxID=2793819 RepID=UPI001CD20512|nr:site-specific integrase [Bradyrhizobium sp. BRP56]MCA1397223.1 site-specific integrase [Bradyrhizobium sp. BRP56]
MLDVKRGLLVADAVTRIIPRRYQGARTARRIAQYGREAKEFFAGRCLEDLTTDDLAAFAAKCEQAGNAPATINLKLSFYSALYTEFAAELRNPFDPRLPFNAPGMPWRSQAKVLKWWLKPELEPKIVTWCYERGENDLADFITFITHTGCRVEEALRLQRDHFNFEAGECTIPGTKTATAERTIPLFTEALTIAKYRLRHGRGDSFLFHFSPSDARALALEAYVDLSYEVAKKKWHHVRVAFGLERNKTATLKALRRTFARRANDNGMPTEILRQYLGHEDIATTIEYLRLIGGYADQMRKYVS